MASSTDDQVLDIQRFVAELLPAIDSIPLAGRNVIRYSYDRLFDPAKRPASIFQLGPVNVRWRLYVTKENGKVVFFFDRKTSPTEVFLDIDVDIEVGPSPMLQPLLMDQSDVRLIWFPPAFVYVHPPQRVLDKLHMSMVDVHNDYAIIVTLTGQDDDVLAAKLRSENDVQFVHAQAGERKEVSAKNFPLSLLLSLYGIIRAWVRGDIKYRPPIKVDTTPDNDMKKVLNMLFQLFMSSNNQLLFNATANNDRQIIGGLPDNKGSWQLLLKHMMPYYMLNKYEASVLLKLGKDGDFAVSHQDNPFQLQVSMNAKWEDDQPALHLHVKPPDFLVSGELFDLFLEEARNHKTQLARLLDVHEKELDEAFAQAPDQASIFRIKKEAKNLDTELIVLPLTDHPKGDVLMFSGIFEVTTGDNKSVKYKGGFKNLITSKGKPEPELVAYFVRLLKYMRKWGDVIQ